MQKLDPILMLRALLGEGRNQGELADEIGISPQYLSQILKGERPPSKLILDFLGLEKVITYRPIRRA